MPKDSDAFNQDSTNDNHPKGCIEFYSKMNEQVSAYRDHLEKQFDQFKKLVYAVCVIIAIFFGFFSINTHLDIKNQIRTSINAKITDEAFLKAMRKNIENKISKELAVANEEIETRVNEQVDSALQSQVGKALAEAANLKIEEIERIDPLDLLRNTLSPLGCILVYTGKLECESGIDEGSIVNAYSLQMPLWPMGTRDWIVCNGSTLGRNDYHESLYDANHSIEGIQVPDLRGRLMRGTKTFSERGKQLGQEHHLHSAHFTADTTQPTGKEPFADVPDKPNIEKVAGYTHHHGVTIIGETKASSNIPPCTNVVFVIRVK